uniref:DUF4283 domain-containing protein n=1 Tax=Tanacetum cinerariifolium TaxID=118510 RepID=A0A699JNW5_TANCI|nr:DUF4283 domain-containing protein [Tanacetum cinerariifolium]
MKNNNQGGMFRLDDTEGIREKVLRNFLVLLSEDKIEHATVNKSFIKAVKKNNDYKSELELIPTGFEKGREVVVFDEELVIKGSKKWELTLCGCFVGYKMQSAELKYNLSRMMESCARKRTEELVSKGSKKWELTLCGCFVGYKMQSAELKYNLSRM